ncbi:MAG: site-2 protease family protein [Anaeromyxobacteraceae bacterium]
MDPAVFRPPMRALGGSLLLGAAAGAFVGGVSGVPLLLGALFGAVSAAIALTARHARSLRLVADERGVRLLGGEGAGGAGLEASWPELRLGFGIAQRGDGRLQRYAILADARGRSFAFADRLGTKQAAPVRGADGREVPVVELRDAPLLLALVVQRAPAWHVFPAALQVAPDPSTPGSLGEPGACPERKPRSGWSRRAQGERSDGGPGSPHRVERPSPRAAAPRESRMGVLALVAKLGSKLAAAFTKLGTGALKAVKTANVGSVVLSAAAYSYFFTWQFGLALLVQLFVHEYGHVHAMRRTGMKVRGMYFVPFLGALAVTEDAFSSRRQQAYVALNGPLWGALLTLVPLGLWAATGAPIWAQIAGSWAFLNLFNLLPITPLDGGRVMQAFALSYASWLGVALSVLGFAAAVAVGVAMKLSLIWIVAALGAMELVSESQARAGARALRLLPDGARFGPMHWLYLRAVVGPTPAAPHGEEPFLRGLERQRRAAHAAPLTARQLVLWGLAYVALAAALLAIVWAAGHAHGGDAARRILE